MNLDFDATMLVQVGFILVLWVVLKPMLFDPLLKLYEEREKKTVGTKLRARRIDEESAASKATYDELMAKARAEGAAVREQLRAESARKESEMLAKVRAETQKVVDTGRAETEREVASTRTALAPHTEALARDLATRVLGRQVS